jgi:hypothetical protein
VRWRYTPYYWVVILLASALIATAADLWLTRNGPGASGDAVHYMQGAQNLLAGHGFSRLRANGQYIPITGFPPGFSVVLAGLGLTGLPVFDAGRYLNAVLFGLNVILVGWLLYRATRFGPFAILGAWLFMYARNILQIHSWVMAEPLFIFLALLSFLLMDLYLKRGKLILLILASLVMAFAGLTRYVGLALAPSAILVTLWFSQKDTAMKWRDAFIIGVFSLGPVGLWFVHNSLSSGNLVNRQLIYHPISKSLIFTLFDELSYWWFALSLSWPWKVRWTLLLIFFLIGAGIYLYTLNKWRNDQAKAQISPIPGMVGLFLAFYVFALLLNTSFIDASTDTASIKRYAIPLVAIGILWTFSAYAQVGKRGWGRTISYMILCCVGLGMVVFYASKSVPFLLHPGFSFGYTDDRRNWTCEVNMLKVIDPQQVVITNDYEEYYFLAGRPAYTLTGKYDPYLDQYVEDFSESILGVQGMLENGAILAVLGKPDQYPPEVNALIGDMGLKAISDCSSLRLYAVPHTP